MPELWESTFLGRLHEGRSGREDRAAAGVSAVWPTSNDVGENNRRGLTMTVNKLARTSSLP